MLNLNAIAQEAKRREELLQGNIVTPEVVPVPTATASVTAVSASTRSEPTVAGVLSDYNFPAGDSQVMNQLAGMISIELKADAPDFVLTANATKLKDSLNELSRMMKNIPGILNPGLKYSESEELRNFSSAVYEVSVDLYVFMKSLGYGDDQQCDFAEKIAKALNTVIPSLHVRAVLNTEAKDQNFMSTPANVNLNTTPLEVVSWAVCNPQQKHKAYNKAELVQATP